MTCGLLGWGTAVGGGAVSLESSGLLDKVKYKLRCNDQKGLVMGRANSKGGETAVNLVLSVP